jgi:hypothetical protein
MIMMTRKDFAALAHALNRTRPARPNLMTVVSHAENWVWDSTVQGIKDVCAASNPRFDADRFHAACRVDFTPAPVSPDAPEPPDCVYPVGHPDGID